MSQDGPFVWKCLFKPFYEDVTASGLGWSENVGWGEVSGNHQGGVNSISQAGGDSDKGLASASTSVWEKAAPSALSLKPDN